MKIEDEYMLKAWITKEVELLSDAEPDSLAKYVTALVKKPKTNDELKRICVEKLTVFLQSNTVDFIDRLFFFIENSFSPSKAEQNDMVDDVLLDSLDDFEMDASGKKENESLKDLNVEESPSPNALPRRRILPPEDSPMEDNGKIQPLIRNREAYHREFRRNRYLTSTGSRSRSPFKSNENLESLFYRPKGICFDFYEKGYCMRGDKCIFNHGNAPVVVDNNFLYNQQGFENPPPPGMEKISSVKSTEENPTGNFQLGLQPSTLSNKATMLPRGHSPTSLAYLNSNSAAVGNAIEQANLNYTPESGLISMSEHNNILTHVLQEIKATKDALTLASAQQQLYSGTDGYNNYQYKPVRRNVMTIPTTTTTATHFVKTSYVPPTKPEHRQRALIKENLDRFVEVHRRRTDLFQRQVEQQRILLLKIQSTKEKEMKKKLLELVERNDEALKTLKGEIETLSEQILALKQQQNNEEFHSK